MGQRDKKAEGRNGILFNNINYSKWNRVCALPNGFHATYIAIVVLEELCAFNEIDVVFIEDQRAGIQ